MGRGGYEERLEHRFSVREEKIVEPVCGFDIACDPSAITAHTQVSLALDCQADPQQKFGAKLFSERG
jgi:hypothetical protein